MGTDTFDPETQDHYKGSHLWKPWMNQIRLWQAGNLDDVVEFLERHQDQRRISWDVETRSLDPDPAGVCGHCLAFDGDEGLYIPVNHVNYPRQNLDSERVWQLILEAIKDRLLVVYNWKFEGYILRRKGLVRSSHISKLNDAFIYRWLFDSDKIQLNLKDAALDLCGCEMLHIQEVPGIQVGKKKKDINFSLSNPQDATLYAAADPVFTLRVLDHCKPSVDKDQGGIVMLEHELYDVLFRMESNRVTIDRGFLRQANIDLDHWIETVRGEIYKLVGKEFNIDSYPETSKVLTELGIPLGKTEKGNPATDAKSLEPLADQFPVVNYIIFYRSLCKEKSTYVEALLASTTEDDPTCVFKFTSVGAPTGRFSSGGVDEGDSLYAAMNVQAIISSASYRMAPCRKVQGVW